MTIHHVVLTVLDRLVGLSPSNFRAACDSEIKQAVSPQTMTRINIFRNARSLVIPRKAPKDLAKLKAPKALADASR